ncbi:hypothetical protein EBX93_14030 [bacterium]|nr:hypothetical protein [bacterium]
MKKYIPIALIALLAGTQIAAVAGPLNDHGQHAEMQATRDEIQKKMAAAKTDEDRQQRMSEQHKKMHGTNHDVRSEMHAQMGKYGFGYMKDMPTNSEDMQKRRQLMQQQMTK